MTEADTPIAWVALRKGAPIYSADGDELGKVGSVIADEQKDIFSGVTLDPGLFKHERFVPADLIAAMTKGGVTLVLSSSDADRNLERT